MAQVMISRPCTCSININVWSAVNSGSNLVNSFFSYLSGCIVTESEQRAGWSSAGILAFFYCITVAYIQRNVLRKKCTKWSCKFGWRLSDLVSFYHIAYGNWVISLSSLALKTNKQTKTTGVGMQTRWGSRITLVKVLEAVKSEWEAPWALEKSNLSFGIMDMGLVAQVALLNLMFPG